jgi:hypothetical protein
MLLEYRVWTDFLVFSTEAVGSKNTITSNSF